ncbi:MAG: SDR family oxidoreductase [Anaerolineaceae bacterium]|nr:SDR family oxidoreductase [Anaerolineaceae bacterium]
MLALVTGAGHRLGREIALDLADLGYAVGIHYHKSSKQAKLTKEEISSRGVPAFLFSYDLTDPKQISKLFKEVEALSNPLHVLVNSAAVMPRCNIMDLETESWDFTMNLNLRAPWICSKYAAKLMIKEGKGIIINVSDTGAGRAWTGYPAYSISKAGLDVLTRLSARSLAPEIRVNAIAPGLIMRSEDMPVSDWQKLIDRLPLQQSGSPEYITQAIRFLIQNDYITGETLVIDGGYQLL